MFCANCGKEVKEGEVFCANCGAIVSADQKTKVEKVIYKAPETVQATDSPKKSEGNKKGKGAIIAIVLVVVLIIAAGVGGALYFIGDSYVSKKNLKLAEKCLKEEDYEEALDYYEEVLKRDSALTEAYLGASDAHLALENYEDALKMLQKGLKKTRGDKDAKEDLGEKLTETYLAAVEAYIDQGNYDEAYALAQEGIEELEDASSRQELQRKQEEIYTFRMTGIYRLQSVEMAGVSVTIEDLVAALGESVDDLNINLELKSNGKFEFDLSDLDPTLVMDGTWESSGKTITLTADGESLEAILDGDTLVMSEEVDGITASITFKKK